MQSVFSVRPAQREQVETTVTLHASDRPVLLGTIVGDDGKPLANALAVLYASGGAQPDTVAGVTCSDALGRFVFGPLEPGVLYQVSIHADTMLRRTLEQPEE